MSKTSKTTISYKQSGVDIEAGNQLVDLIKPYCQKTKRKEVIGNLGGFGAMCRIPEKYRHPILVSATDGVGTKLKLAHELGIHSTIGIDLVAMCVNDLVVIGAEPLQFLDYFATGKLDVETAAEVIKGIAKGCEQAGCALVGGETAEMPDMYAEGNYDLAGFAQGVVEEKNIIDGTQIKAEDQLIGLKSNGLHSNGYSLVRYIIKQFAINIHSETVGGITLAEELLKPTTIYVKPLLNLFEQINVHGVAHITGGGLLENIPRILPKDHSVVVDADSWDRPPIFSWLQQKAQIENQEMYRTFNCGIGMIVIVEQQDIAQSLSLLQHNGIDAVKIGTVQHTPAVSEVVIRS